MLYGFSTGFGSPQVSVADILARAVPTLHSPSHKPKSSNFLQVRLSLGNRRCTETPVGLKRLGEDNTDKEFSGFREEKGNVRRLMNVEKEMRYMKEVISSIMENKTN
ncbi:hypothetical protein E2C01_034406 [Portunus trituberculatus]|uniref:Uncharacterized protein n=1 Tax=Portunus trituberculatus TaxID=210409 RepID=A0A5B7F5S1_PORTR|nr:hypothetical protein [Portunus trituberculatus]